MSLPRLPEGLPENYVVHPQVLKLINTKQYVQRTPEWYERRKTLMTASNVSTALGIPPYASFRGDVRDDGLRKLVDGSFRGNVATRHGVRHEDMVRDHLCDVMGEICLEFGLIVHESVQWLGASPDGICLSGRMVEIKCPYKRRIIPGHVPHHYMPQIQAQLFVCGLEECYFCEWQPAHLNPDGSGEILNIVVVQKDPLWFEKHRDALYGFWKDLMRLRESYVPAPPPKCMIVDNLYGNEQDSAEMMPSAFLPDV